MPEEQPVPKIAEKVRFWEEQDKINQAIIPRILELHEKVIELSKRFSNSSEQIAAIEGRMIERIEKKVRVSYAALFLALFACILSLARFFF
jgi:hypothetical protein